MTLAPPGVLSGVGVNYQGVEKNAERNCHSSGNRKGGLGYLGALRGGIGRASRDASYVNARHARVRAFVAHGFVSRVRLSIARLALMPALA